MLRRLYRRLYWWPNDLAWGRRLRGIEELVYFGDRGIGDDLLCTAVLHEMQKRGRTKVAMMSNWPELFENLPYPAKVVPFDYGALHCIERAGVKLLRPTYAEVVSQDPERFVFHEGKLIEAMCRLIGVSGEVDPRPYFRCRAVELEKWKNLNGCIVVQTSRANPRFEFGNKEWGADNWTTLSRLINAGAHIVQVGGGSDTLFPGATDLRGQTSLRDLGAIIAQARLFIGLEGFMMHLARAVGTRAVIVYGGWIDPATSGYAENVNLFTSLPCSPCGFSNHCDFDRECMRRITPEEVAEAVREELG